MGQFALQAQPVIRPTSPPPPAPVASVPPPPIVSAPVQPILAHVEVPAPRASRLFADRGALIRGIVAAEVLGKPLALRDE